MERIRIASGGSRVPFMEHRWGQRLPCRARVTIFAGPGIEGTGRVRDISSSGAFIETLLEIPVHSRITLTVVGNESQEQTVDIAAIVLRSDPAGVGIEWCETPVRPICEVVGCTSRCHAIAGANHTHP